MQKDAETNFPVHSLIAKRWSPRVFSQRLISPEIVGSLLEAARWAPSCFNEQPWRFIVANRGDRGDVQKVASCLVDANRAWAAQAPLLILALARTIFSHNGKVNKLAWHDVGLAVANLVTQATAHDLYAHQMAGIQADLIKTTFGLPEDVAPVTAIAVGYMGDPASLPEQLAAREAAPRTRRPAEELFFQDQWGTAF